MRWISILVIGVLLAGFPAGLSTAVGASAPTHSRVTVTATAAPISTTPTATPRAETPGPPKGVSTAAEWTVPPNTTYAARVDPALRIVSYRWDEGTLRVTFEAEVPRVVTLSGRGDSGKGVSQFRIKRVPLPVGVTTVTFNSSVAFVTTAESIERGYGVKIQASSSGANPVRSLSSLHSLLTGAAVAIGWVVVAGWRELRKEHQEPKEAIA